MRTVVVTYCLLTMLFTGGCAMLLLGVPANEMPRKGMENFGLVVTILLLALAANTAFLAMALSDVSRRVVIGCVAAYGIAEMVLAVLAGRNIGMAAMMFPLLLLKGGALVILASMKKPGPG